MSNSLTEIEQDPSKLHNNKWSLRGQKFKLFWLKFPFYLGCITGLTCFGLWTSAVALLDVALVPWGLVGILGLAGLGALILTIGFAIIHNQLSGQIKRVENNIRALEDPVNSPKNSSSPKKENDYQPEKQTNLPTFPEVPHDKGEEVNRSEQKYQRSSEITSALNESFALAQQYRERRRELINDPNLTPIEKQEALKSDPLLQELEEKVKESKEKREMLLQNQRNTLEEKTKEIYQLKKESDKEMGKLVQQRKKLENNPYFG